MKGDNKVRQQWRQMSDGEMQSVAGGGEIRNYVRCVVTTLATGRGAMRTILFGFGLFGGARALGVAVGCL